MIDKVTWKKLEKEWGKIGKVYQERRRVEHRLAFFCEHALEHLRDKNVHEIGCNAGVYAIPISTVAHSYTGIEPGNKIAKKPYKTNYFKQAQMTENWIGLHQVHFKNMTLREFVEADQEYPLTPAGEEGAQHALVAAYCLYHWSDSEIELFKCHMLAKYTTVIIQTRNQKRPKKHNSYKFWKARNVEKFFHNQGFEVNTIWEKDKKFSLQVCLRPSVAAPASIESLQ